jgi:phage gp29-like protein
MEGADFGTLAGSCIVTRQSQVISLALVTSCSKQLSFLFKNYGIRDVMEFLETYGLPSKIGKYPSGATEKEK